MTQLRDDIEKLIDKYESDSGVYRIGDLTEDIIAVAEAAVEAERWPLVKLLREAHQYVSDAGSDEDSETVTHSGVLLAAIDDAIARKP